MRTQYWYDVRKLMRKWGFSKLKSKSIAWKVKHLMEDLATFKNPEDPVKAINNALIIGG